jgi:hypothetical protein
MVGQTWDDSGMCLSCPHFLTQTTCCRPPPGLPFKGVDAHGVCGTYAMSRCVTTQADD